MGLTDQHFEIDGTHYRVDKLSAWEGWILFEELRKHLGDVVDQSEMEAVLGLDVSSAEGRAAAGAALGRVILKLDPRFTQAIFEKISSRIYFRNESVREYQDLTGALELATDDPLVVHELLLRALAINFGGSRRLRALVPAFGAPITNLLSQWESRQSSQESSTPASAPTSTAEIG